MSEEPDAPRPAEPVGPRHTGDETGTEEDQQTSLPPTENPRPATPVGPHSTGNEGETQPAQGDSENAPGQ